VRRATILLADDHELIIEGLRHVLEPYYQIVGVAGDGRALLIAAAGLQPDVIIVDVSMPLLNGIEAVRQMRKTGQKAKIIFLSMHPDLIYVTEALQAGGAAYVLKSSAGTDIATAVRHVLQGKTFLSQSIDQSALDAQIKRERPARRALDTLTQRQREVLQLMAEGRNTKEIAQILGVSPRTIEFHRYRLMETLGLHTIAELVQFAIRHRIVEP
jgi:DNA-binding NarL/FixJ family response regulator